jgi:hypothetical protein
MQWKSLRRSQRIQPKGNRVARRIVAARNDHAAFKARTASAPPLPPGWSCIKPEKNQP